MKEKDLFYYLVEENKDVKQKLEELIFSSIDFKEKGITEQQECFIKDFYCKLIFDITLLRYQGYTPKEIIGKLNVLQNFELVTLNQLNQINGNYLDAINFINEIISKTYENSTQEN